MALPNTNKKVLGRGVVGPEIQGSTPASGIRNAELRYKKRVDDLSTRAHIRARTKAGPGTLNDPEEEGEDQQRGGAMPRGRAAQIKDAQLQREAERVFREQELEYDPGEIQEMLETKPPAKPPFPIVILFLALVKDILDAFTLTGVGYVLSLAISFIIGCIIFIWLLAKGGSPWKKRQMKKSVQRFVAANLVDLIPVINILPIETIFILMTYFDEKRAAENIEAALGKLGNLRRFLKR